MAHPRRAEPVEIEWIHLDGVPMEGGRPDNQPEPSGRSWSRPWAVLIVVVVGALVWSSLDGGSETQPTPVAPQPPEPQPYPPSGVGGGAGVAARGPADTGTAEAVIAELAELGLALRAVVMSPDWTRSALVSADGAGSAAVRMVPALTGWAFDPSGRWLAGLGSTFRVSARTTLLVADGDGELDLMADAVDSFAWHDTRPGVIGWTGPEGLITTVDLAEPGSQAVRIPAPPTGYDVRGWGDWGFAAQSPGRADTTTVLGPDGHVIAADVPGRFLAHVAGTGVIVSRGPDPPVAIDTITGAIAPVRRIVGHELDWRVEAAGSLSTILPLVGRGSRPVGISDGEVVVVRDGPRDVLAAVVESADLGRRDGGRLVVAELRSLEGVWGWSIVFVDTDRQVHRVPLPDFLGGEEWVPAVAGDALVLLGGASSGG